MTASVPPPSGDEAHGGSRGEANSRLQGVDIFLLVVGLLAALSGLIYVARVPSDPCSSRTTTTTVTAADADRQVSGKKEIVKACEPTRITAGYPEAALLVGLVLVLPAVSRRIAAGFELSAFGNKIGKTRPSRIAKNMNATAAQEAANDPAG